METPEITEYTRCRNCDRFFEKTKAYREYYCSEECAEQFSRCANCGRYFSAAGNTTEPYCSAECMTRYSEDEIVMQRG